MAQIPRAILPAKAMATSMRGFRDNMRASHVPSAAPFREAQFTTAIAPVTRRRRISRCPIFDVLPRRCLPPLEFCLGTRPSHAAKSRPRLNWSIGGAKVSIANAPTGPTPGMVCRRRDVSCSFEIVPIRFLRSLIDMVSCAMWFSRGSRPSRWCNFGCGRGPSSGGFGGDV